MSVVFETDNNRDLLCFLGHITFILVHLPRFSQGLCVFIFRHARVERK